MLTLTDSGLQVCDPLPDVEGELLGKQTVLGHVHLTVVEQLLHTVLEPRTAAFDMSLYHLRGGSIGRASDSTSKDPRFEPRQEHKHILRESF